eukprot:TRINITY_DN1337_c0_g1_i1.p1 TRINITY_DN1337_c0_g1~~TRINITY_DN1337_c0_g1_i1.p1  ORF type:complete len:327 (+),score=46.32 TRINITY_DN1337_c0_g1_i1:24-1004(+)
MASKKTVNIPRSVIDDHYRYKRHELILKVEGRGKMIKTIIENLSVVAKDLERPAVDIMKYFGFSLSSPVQIDGKNDKFSIGGNRDLKELNDILDKYIDIYVLCQVCGNPETIMAVGKRNIKLNCRACGETSVNSEVNDKFGSYLTKKPTVSDKKTEEEYVEDEFEKETEETETPEGSQNVTELSMTGNPINALKSYWRSNPSSEAIEESVKRLQSKHKMNDVQLLHTIFTSLFDKDYSQDFDHKSEIVKLFIPSKKLQQQVMICIEGMCVSDQSLIPKISSILECFMDNEVIDEDNIFKWFDSTSSKDKVVAQKLRKTCEKFVDKL